MRRLALLLLFSASLWAEDLYVAQTAAGSDDGSSCANAHAVTFFNTAGNWGGGAGEIDAGDTAHLCGTITTALTAQGNGSSGSVITLLFETGAKVSFTVCPSTGCLDITDRSYILVDGGTTCGWVNGAVVACNGTVEATASGSAYGNGGTSAFGIDATNCANCEIRNINLSNVYQHTSSSDSPGGDFRGINQLGISTAGAYFRVHNNIIDDVASAIAYVPGSANDNGFQVYNNYFYNINSSVDISNNNGGDLTAALIHDNRFSSTANWDADGCPAHHNSLHAFAYTTTNSGIDYYNNLIDGEWGTCSTGGLFIEGNGSVNNDVRVFNNTWLISSYTQMSNGIVSITAGGTVDFHNNTIIGQATSDTCLWIDGLAGSTIRAENNVITNCGTIFATRTVSYFSAVDYNIYAGPANEPWTDQSLPAWYSTLAAWRTRCACDANAVYNASASYPNLAATGIPNVGSPVIGVGVNLTSLGIAALNSDKAGVARPSSGAWDAGAYYFGAGVFPQSTPKGIRGRSVRKGP